MKNDKLVQEKLNQINGTYDENSMFKSLINSDEELLKNFQLFCEIYQNNNFLEQKFLNHTVNEFKRNKDEEIDLFDLKKWIDLKNKVDSYDTQNFDLSNNFFKKMSLKSGELSFLYDSFINENDEFGEFDFGEESRFNNNETSVIAKTTEVVVNKVLKL